MLLLLLTIMLRDAREVMYEKQLNEYELVGGCSYNQPESGETFIRQRIKFALQTTI